MDFNVLPINVQEQIKNLVFDQQFQKRFSQDKELDKLDEQKHDKEIQFYQLQLLLNRCMNLCNIKFNPITIALFCYLYTIKSSVIVKDRDITMIDLDIFFYLLQTKDYNFDIKSVYQKSLNYCSRVLHLEQKDVISVFNKIYKVQFRVLSLFPNKGEESQCLFNLDWALNFVSRIKPLVSYSTMQIYKDVPITQLYYYFADYCRGNGSDSIYIRTEQQILIEEDHRICQLVLERLVEKGIILKEQVDKYLKLIVCKSQEN